VKHISYKLIWFDSLGAKSSCVLVKTPDTSILIDPGAAEMQPSYPASWEEKMKWLEEAESAIKKASKKAKIIVISHYHYDHFTDFDEELYDDKLILAKNPNKYINDSQRGRAEEFYGNILEAFGTTDLKSILEKKEQKRYPNPMTDLPISKKMSFGSYDKRRKELLSAGYGWFRARARNWNARKKIPEFNLERVQVQFCDGREFKFGKTRIKFTMPLFHGIEYSRVGWIFATSIRYGKEKIIHSSDMNGPIIEDYAEWIIKENPDVLFLDGPMTYMFGYLLNRTNLNRAIENASRIVREVDSELIVYDHHLPREPKFKERTQKVWETAEECGRKLKTAAEVLGKKHKF
jgi:predicted metallo-beta-lactamase superfamily hydrolase